MGVHTVFSFFLTGECEIAWSPPHKKKKRGALAFTPRDGCVRPKAAQKTQKRGPYCKAQSEGLDGARAAASQAGRGAHERAAAGGRKPKGKKKKRPGRPGPPAHSRLEQEDAQLFAIVFEQAVLCIVRYVVAKALTHAHIPRGPKLFLQRLLHRLRRLFIVLRGAGKEGGGGNRVRGDGGVRGRAEGGGLLSLGADFKGGRRT